MQLKNHPYLRTNRFLASFSTEIDEGAAFDDWVKRLQFLDQKARFFEIANLPPKSLTDLYSKTGDTDIREKVIEFGDGIITPTFIQFHKLPAPKLHGVVTRVEL